MEDEAVASKEDAEYEARELRQEACYRRQSAMELAIKLNHPGAVSAETTVANAKVIDAFLAGD